jgi:hypothetical protein
MVSRGSDVRVVAPILCDLCLDLQSSDIGLDTAGILNLYNSVDDLRRRLATLLKRPL